MSEQQLSQQVSLRTALEARQLHSLEFLTAPLMELEQKISAELAANPVLEADESYSLRSDVPDLPAPRSDMDYDEDRDGFQENMEKMLVRESESGMFEADPTANEEAEERRQYMFDSLANPDQSLQEYLLDQLRCTPMSPLYRRAATEIIGGIDDNGYLQTALGDVAQSALCSLEEAENALKLVQSFDPPGIAARTPQECLLLQLERKKIAVEPYERLLTEFAEDLARNRMPKIAKEMNLSLDELQNMMEFLRTLTPHPGSTFNSKPAPYILPEATVIRREDGEYDVVPNKEHTPSFHISEKYLEMLEDPEVPEETRKYLKEKILSGRQIQKSLELRETTVMRIAKLLVAAQHDFLEQGPGALRPLTQKEIADKMNLHETTIGRAIANKYMQTPRGLIPFHDFFAGGYESEEGEEITAAGIKEIIQDAVDNEDPTSPLSDSSIEKILSERGYTVARRTIAKYREALGIPSSQGRKKYQK